MHDSWSWMQGNRNEDAFVEATSQAAAVAAVQTGRSTKARITHADGTVSVGHMEVSADCTHYMTAVATLYINSQVTKLFLLRCPGGRWAALSAVCAWASTSQTDRWL